jgi:hypothetical protein
MIFFFRVGRYMTECFTSLYMVENYPNKNPAQQAAEHWFVY